MSENPSGLKCNKFIFTRPLSYRWISRLLCSMAFQMKLLFAFLSLLRIATKTAKLDRILRYLHKNNFHEVNRNYVKKFRWICNEVNRNCRMNFNLTLIWTMQWGEWWKSRNCLTFSWRNSLTDFIFLSLQFFSASLFWSYNFLYKT